MADDDTITRDLEKKAERWDKAREDTMRRISGYVEEAKSKLDEAERKLLDEVEAEFGENPFSAILARISSDSPTSPDEIRSVLAKEIPSGFGPDEDSFRFFLKEIEGFEGWRGRIKRSELTPRNVRAVEIKSKSITFAWDNIGKECFYEIESWSSPSELKTYRSPKPECALLGLEPETEYHARVRTVLFCKGIKSNWSDPIVVRTKHYLSESFWKECPDDVDLERKYSVGVENPRIATKINDDFYCTIIGNTPLPPNKVTSWSIKILKSRGNDGGDILIGVAPSDIDQDKANFNKCGWYFHCYSSTLHSGPPHSYKWPRKEYGPRKEDGNYVHTGDSVGVVMDTAKGELSFALDGVNLGVAYEGIPLDKPLVPCVILRYKGDSVELDTSEVRENVDSSIPVPSNITAKSITWDSITLTWDAVERASFYQIEVDGSKSWDASTTNTFTKRGILPDTEYTFRVRAVRGSSLSEWSGAVKGRTQKAPKFDECIWKECPDDAHENRKYSIDVGNPRIATKVGGDYDHHTDPDYCTIIGNTPLPLNKVTSWSIKVLESEDNDGGAICIGVAPFDIDQNEWNNPDKCGWCFNCYRSSLWSGPPHNYWMKEYGPRKEEGEYVHTGDSVGVVMDATKGELSFVVNGVNLGVAYEGIPLDKSLVPCVFLLNEGDSVELDTSEVKENAVDSPIPVPFNITAKSPTWDSITLTWDAVEGASFYQIEVDGSKFWDASTTNTFTKRGLLAETEHTFRIRAVRGNSVSKWSGVVRGRAKKAPKFSECIWKECPGNGYVGFSEYSVDEENPRIATKIGGYGCCTIIGNTPLPLNKVTSWSIKVLKSWNNNGDGIFIGVAPSDINQNRGDNYNKCGWYFYCYHSRLCSGPPHNYEDKPYGPRKRDGQYVHTGDSVGVVMDTVKGELSFVVNGVNLGVAYEGIPLDKPLVPCVLLWGGGDSVELVN